MQIKIDPICFFNIASQYYHTRLSGILVGKITADCMHIQQSFDLPIENALEHYNDRIQQLQVFQLEPIGCYGQAINLGLPLDYYFEFQKLQLFQIDRNNPGQYHNNSQEYQLNKQEFKVVGSKSQTTAIQQFLESNTNPYKSLLLLQKNALLMLRKRLLVISEFISTTNDLEIMEKVQNIMARMELIPTFHGNDLINLIGITSRVNKACQLLAEIESKTRVLQNY